MNFDETQRARQQQLQADYGEHPFTLRGETFYVGRNVPYAALKEVALIRENSADGNAFSAIEAAVLGMLTGGPIPDDELGTKMESRTEARERFLSLTRTNHDFPITYADLLEIHNWMVAEATKLPPTQPTSSSPSPSSTGDGSMENSSPEPAAA